MNLSGLMITLALVWGKNQAEKSAVSQSQIIQDGNRGGETWSDSEDDLKVEPVEYAV